MGEIVGADPGLQLRLRVLEEDEEIDLGAGSGGSPARDRGLDEQEALRQREVLAQQPIANEGLARAGRSA